MTVLSVTPILNVSDVGASLSWFHQLGWKTTFVWQPDGSEKPGFAGTGMGDAEIFMCRDGQGARDARAPTSPFDESTGGVWMSWFLDSPGAVEEMHERAVALGLDVTMPPLDMPWGIREFHLRHPDGHTFRIGSEIHG